ncbi:MAG: hypothetical protein ACYSRZ_00270 [Planctomycetota bacterium]
MDFFDELLRKTPGDPISVAETLLRAYKKYQAENPQGSKKDALRYVLETHYRMIKSMSSEKMESILEEANALGHLTFLVVTHDYSVAAKPMFMKQTVLDLYKFFQVNAPEELEGLDSLKKIVSV